MQIQVPEDISLLWESPYGVQFEPWRDCKKAAVVAQEMAGEEFFNVNRYGGPPASVRYLTSESLESCHDLPRLILKLVQAGYTWDSKWPEDQRTVGLKYPLVMDMKIAMSQESLAFIRNYNTFETYVDVDLITVSSPGVDSVSVTNMRMRPRGQSTVGARLHACMRHMRMVGGRSSSACAIFA